MLFSLVFRDAPDTGIKAHLRGESGRFDTSFTDLLVFDTDSDFWHADHTLFASHEVSYKYIHEVGGYALCMNAPSDVFSLVETAAAKKETAIRRALENNVKDLNRRFSSIRKAFTWKPSRRAWEEIKDIATTLAVKAADQIVKS